jgi:hypothetical protein
VSTARHCWAVALFFINCSKLTCGTRTAYFFLSSRWHFSVEQSRFLRKVSRSRYSSRRILSSWPWLCTANCFNKLQLKVQVSTLYSPTKIQFKEKIRSSMKLQCKRKKQSMKVQCKKNNNFPNRNLSLICSHYV